MDHVITEATVHVDDDLGIHVTYANPDGTAVVVERGLFETLIQRANSTERFLSTVIAPNVGTAIDVEQDSRLVDHFMSGLLGEARLRVDAWEIAHDDMTLTVTRPRDNADEEVAP